MEASNASRDTCPSLANEGPCYRCLFPERPAPGSSASCEEIGVLGAVPGVIGALQATEALKVVARIGKPLIGRLLQIDLATGVFQTIRFARRPDCPACASRGRGVETQAVQDVDSPFEIEPAEVARSMGTRAAPRLLDVREPWEWSIATIGEPQLVPIGQLENAVDSLDRSSEMIVYCHHGTRSAAATHWLRTQGFRARNLAGGIDRWSREIDRTVPRY